MNRSHTALSSAVYKILKPLVRILLRNGVPFAAFVDIAKRAYVDIATKEFSVAGKRQTNSRIAIITGLTRKEITRLVRMNGRDDERDMVTRYNRAARVVYGWVHDEKYNQADGEARLLEFDGDGPSFCQLVKEYSGDVPPRAILDELLRVGVVQYADDERIKLLQRAYIPASSAAEKLVLLGRDVSGLINTMDKNIHAVGHKPLFQRKIFYDNLPEEAVHGIQMLLADEGQAFLERFDRFMSEQDRDVNPTVVGNGRRAVGIGLYYFEEEIAQEAVLSQEKAETTLEEAS